MARSVVFEKLESLRRCLVRIEAKCPDSVEGLINDLDLQDIITLNLTRSVQLCVDIGAHLIAHSELTPPRTMGATFDKLLQLGVVDIDTAERLKKSVGFRNLAVHGYEDIDFAIVFSIITKRLGDFHDYARQVAAWLESGAES